MIIGHKTNQLLIATLDSFYWLFIWVDQGTSDASSKKIPLINLSSNKIVVPNFVSISSTFSFLELMSKTGIFAW